MKISVLSLFPEMFESLRCSILGKAIEKNIFQLELVNIRDFSKDKHKRCDDYSFGGGQGMVMTPQPIFDAVQATDPAHNMLRIFMSPKGKLIGPHTAQELAGAAKDLLIVCGHYEGIDQRAIDLCMDVELSIGDYVLTGGELPAMVLIDAVARFIPQVLGNADSAHQESFSNGLLEYPQYTRPQEFRGLEVPEVLLSGHHAQITQWRREEAEKITRTIRPDLYAKYTNEKQNPDA